MRCEKGKTMIDEYDKCRFCKNWDDNAYDFHCFCIAKNAFKADKQKIIEKAKETGLSVADIVALIELE